MSVVTINEHKYDIDCILFDKDGTIMDFTLWIRWAEELVNLIGKSDHSYDKDLLAQALGFSYNQQTWDPEGPLAIGSSTDLLTILASGLYQQKVPWNHAYQVVNDAFHKLEDSFVIEEHVKPIHGLTTFLEQAKVHDIKMGVVTSDNYNKAVDHLNALGIKHYFSTIIGHDLVQQGKPYPDMVFQACEQLQVKPEKTLIIGDSNGDMILGKQSGTMASIGIVAVPTMETAYLKDADSIINNYEAITVTKI